MMGPWAGPPLLRLPTLIFLQGSVVCHLLGLTSDSRPCLHLSFTAEYIDAWVSESRSIGGRWVGPWRGGGQVGLALHSESPLTSGAKTPA